MAFLAQNDYRVESLQSNVVQYGISDTFNTTGAAPYVFTYNFPATNPEAWDMGPGNPLPPWQAITSSTHQAAIRNVLNEFESVANVRFDVWNGTGDPTLDFGRVDFPNGGGVDGYGGWKFQSNGAGVVTNFDNFAVF